MKKYRYKKYYKRKKRKSILKSRFFWLIFLILIISSAAVYFFIFSSFFQVEKIEVIGNNKIATSDIENIIASNINRKIIFFETKNIFLVDLRKVNEVVLKKFPQISQAGLKRKMFNTLRVSIKERRPIALFCLVDQKLLQNSSKEKDNPCFLIDEEGVIFKKVLFSGSGFIIKEKRQENDLILGDPIIKKEKVKKILEIKSKMENILKNPISQVLISGDRLDIKTLEGWEVYFTFQKDIGWQLIELKTVLEKIPREKRKNLKYIDLRFDKVYVFPAVY